MSHDVFINDFLKHAFGMHDVANQVSRLRQSNQAFPPYNIIVDNVESPSKYLLEMAVAGFKKEQITVKIVKENGVSLLVIEGAKPTAPDTTKQYLVNGLAARAFRREFSMNETVKVDSVQLVDGILSINLSTQAVLQKETVLQIN